MNFFLHHYLIWDVRLEEPNELVVDDHIRMELALTGLIQQVPTDFFFFTWPEGGGVGQPIPTIIHWTWLPPTRSRFWQLDLVSDGQN